MTRGRYNINNQIKFKNSMLKSSLCDYDKKRNDKKVVFKISAPYTDSMTEINNT